MAKLFSFISIMISKIILENIKIYAYHGVLPEETILGTYYLVNAEIHADLWKATESDDLKDTINYALVNEIIHQEMKIPSQLLEHVIGRIMKRIAEEFKQVNFIKIKLTKVQPPMPGEMTGVSLEMEKHSKTHKDEKHFILFIVSVSTFSFRPDRIKDIFLKAISESRLLFSCWTITGIMICRQNIFINLHFGISDWNMKKQRMVILFLALPIPT